MDDIRLDKYLWAVRVFKTRSDAADAIRTNKVTVNGSFAKPSREVKIGDLIAVRKRQVTYSYKVLGLVSSRQGARNVPGLLPSTSRRRRSWRSSTCRARRSSSPRPRYGPAPPRRSGASWIRSWTRYFTTTGRFDVAGPASRSPGAFPCFSGRSALPGGFAFPVSWGLSGGCFPRFPGFASSGPVLRWVSGRIFRKKDGLLRSPSFG